MTSPFKDITGVRYGNLVAIAPVKHKDKSNSSKGWLCQCDCGNQVVKSLHKLRDGFRLHCGDLTQHQTKRRFEDLSGKRFGTLVAISPTTRLPNKAHRTNKTWLCQCDCGNTVVKLAVSLKSPCRVTCGDRFRHPELDKVLPATPVPYPPEAARIVQKYLHLTKARFSDDNPQFGYWEDLVDHRMDLLLRAAWIVVYMKQQGKHYTPRQTKSYIDRCLRYAQREVLRARVKEKTIGKELFLLAS